MKTIKAKLLAAILVVFITACMTFCNSETGTEQIESSMEKEMAAIDSLLRDATFTESMARTLDSSYYAGIGETQPAFLKPGDDTSILLKSGRNEKIAMKLAGLYALECGIGLLSAQTANSTPVEWLQKITTGTIDSNAVLVLNRFANATWKAGQPFRGLARITKSNFIIASSLGQDEISKDYFQIRYSAEKLLSSMKAVSNHSLLKQMEMLRQLLQDTAYALEIASYLHSSHDTINSQSNNPFLTPADDSSTISKTVKEMKIATSIAGFYALECTLNYLVTTKNQLPSIILQSLLNNSISKEDKMLFARFANATWKAGQPFRELNRITRPTFTPFYFLTEADIEKDMVQIRSAAQKLLPLL